MTAPTTAKQREDQEFLAQMREDCLSSLYIFAKVCCGYTDLTESLHRDVCDFLQNDPSIRKLLMLPRDHYKSSLAIAFVIWRLLRDPEERILIAGDTADTAQKKLLKIRGVYKESKMLRTLFPEAIPYEAREGKLPGSNEKLNVPRKEAHAEPSVTATGVTGARAGAHYTLILCDDIFTKEAKEQPSTAQKIIEWADGTEALLEEPYENEIIVIGTPWHHEDVYNHLAHPVSGSWRKSSMEGFYSEYVQPFFDDDGEPIFPELYGGRENAFDFAERMAATNPYLWSANYELNPKVPHSEFDEDDLQYYTLDPTGEYILYRPEEMDEPKVLPLSSGQVYIAVDPAFKKDATASKAAINVSLLAPNGLVFVLETHAGHYGTDGLIDRLCDLVMKYNNQLHRIGVERVAQQQSFIDYLNREMRRRGIYRRVDPLPPGSTKSKEARIRSILQPFFGQRRVWIRVNMTSLIDEFRKFPLSKERDQLDAMAYAADNYWSKYGQGMNTDYQKYIEKYERDRASASPTTGY